MFWYFPGTFPTENHRPGMATFGRAITERIMLWIMKTKKGLF